jgi:hypothetical protein
MFRTTNVAGERDCVALWGRRERMKLFVCGDKDEAYCGSCARFMPTTLRYRDVPFGDGRAVVKRILVDVCDHCDDVVAVPPQSVPSIRAGLRDVSAQLI